jgi:polyphosphate kinase 2 (PPK2 family)
MIGAPGDQSMNLAKRLRVDPGSTVDLGAIDPSFHGEHNSEVEASKTLRNNLGLMSKLQRELDADRKHFLLIVLQGIDGAGKDGICWP